MYKTNAKRKSHILKNHPNCNLPEKPTDKVRDNERIMAVINRFISFIIIIIIIIINLVPFWSDRYHRQRFVQSIGQ